MVAGCHCRRESYLPITPITPANLSRQTQNSNQAPDATSFFPVGGMPTARKPFSERLLSEKSGRCGNCSIKERGALPMIDRGYLPAIDCCSKYLAHCRALVMVVWSTRADSLIAKFKEAGEWSEIDV